MSLQNLAPFGGSIPSLVTNQYLQLRQEAEYVQERIIALKNLHRVLLRETIKTERQFAEPHFDDDFSKDIFKSKKRATRKARSRLNRIARNQQVFEERMAMICAEARRLEQRQWRYSAPQLSLPAEGTFAAPSTMAIDRYNAARPVVPDWSHPRTPALSNFHMSPGLTGHHHAQSFHHPLNTYQARTPMAQPFQFSRPAYTQPTQPTEGFLPDYLATEASPSDLVIVHGFSFGAVQIDLANAVNDLDLSQAESTSGFTPTTSNGAVPFEHQSIMRDHQGAALRLLRVAGKKTGHART